MRITTLFNKLIGLQGVWVRAVKPQIEKGRLVVDVVPRARRPRCGGCRQRCRRVKDRQHRHWRHLNVFGIKTFLRYRVRRVVCRSCGVKTELVPWAAPRSRFTRAFEHEVAWLVQRTDLTAAQEFFAISWRSVRRIIKSVLDEEWNESQRLDGLYVIGVDEISYRKRHKYLTLVVDHLSGRVVWAGKDRKAKTLLRFFHLLGPQRAAELDAVSMDMWEPYLAVVRKKAPQAAVIFDRFHIVRHLNRAVDEVRRMLVRRSRGQARRDLKNTKFPLLRSRWNRRPEDEIVLEHQVRANKPLYRALLLKDDFMDIYTYKSERTARAFVRNWTRRAMRSRLDPVKRVARMIRTHLDGIVGWVTWKLSNGRLEGTNNRARLLSHRSYGLHSAGALIHLIYLCCGGLQVQRAVP